MSLTHYAQYMGAICGLPGQETPTLEGTVLNRTNMLERMKAHEEQADYCAAHSVPYVIGETNSIAVNSLLPHPNPNNH